MTGPGARPGSARPSNPVRDTGAPDGDRGWRTVGGRAVGARRVDASGVSAGEGFDGSWREDRRYYKMLVIAPDEGNAIQEGAFSGKPRC